MWLFVAAHVAFLVLGLLILNDVCAGPDTFPVGKDSSALGLEYISEKIMVCHYATSRWAWLPESIGVALSVIMIQHMHTLQALAAHAHTHPPWIVLNALLGTVGWGLLVLNDHRKPVQDARNEFELHLFGVGLFVFSLFAVHALIAYRYLHFQAIRVDYAKARRYTYVAGDSVYICLVLGFLVLVFVRQAYDAIIVEYVLALVVVGLNTLSLLLLVRLGWFRECGASLP
jgi:hypothetical protein